MAEITAQNRKLKTGQLVTIRTARPDDAEAIIRHAKTILAEDLFNVTTLEEFQQTVETERKWIQEHLDHAGRILLVAESGGRIAGMLGVENAGRKRLEHIGNMHMSVHPEFRRMGVAAALMDAVIGWAEKDPVIEKLTLEVFSTNEAAIRLYEKMGFQREGTRAKAVKLGEGKYVDDILMAKFVKGE